MNIEVINHGTHDQSKHGRSRGGGSKKSGPKSKGGGGSKKEKVGKHSVKLPKNKSRVSLGQTHAALTAMGMKPGSVRTRMVKGKFVTQMKVTLPSGKSGFFSTDSIKSVIYAGAR